MYLSKRKMRFSRWRLFKIGQWPPSYGFHCELTVSREVKQSSLVDFLRKWARCGLHIRTVVSWPSHRTTRHGGRYPSSEYWKNATLPIAVNLARVEAVLYKSTDFLQSQIYYLWISYRGILVDYYAKCYKSEFRNVSPSMMLCCTKFLESYTNLYNNDALLT